MYLFVIPIEHFLLDGIKKLGKLILIPIDYVLMNEYSLDFNLTKEDEEIIEYIVTEHTDILVDFGKLEYCTLAIKVTDLLDNTDGMQLNRLFMEIDKALDYIAITQYRFDRKEWLISIPGSLKYAKIGWIINKTLMKVEVCVSNIHNFCEIPGIGLEVSFESLKEMDEELYEFIFSNRKDEVYEICRNYIARACRAFYLTDLNGVFSHLFSVLEGIGMVGSNNFLKFTLENERIMSFLASNQQEYEQRLDEFCYYSETLRTLIVHEGKDILEFMDIKSAFRVLTTLFHVIIRYAVALMKLNITSLINLEKRIKEQVEKYEKHLSHLETFVLKLDKLDCEGERDVFIIPIENFELEEMLVYKNLIIVPKNYHYVNSEISISGISEYKFKRIIENEDVIELNKNVTIILYNGAYKLDKIDMSETAWQYLDDICSKIKDELVFVYLENCKLENRDGFLGIVGIYRGHREGILYDNMYDEFYPLLGRVYSLYNNTKSAFVYNSEKVSHWVYKATLGSERNDIIALDCKVAIQYIGKALYADDINYSYIYLFDALEYLCTFNYNINYKWKWIAAFVMKRRSEYDTIHDRLVEIGNKYRTPIFHYGKTIYDIIVDNKKVFLLFDEIKKIILEYCAEVLSTGLETYEDLKAERLIRMNIK